MAYVMAAKPKILSTAIFDVAFASQDAEVAVLPFISVEAIEGEELEQEIGKLFEGERNVVFTSAHAVTAISRCRVGEVPKWKIYCIGNATARAVKEHLGEELIAGTADNAAALADIIKEGKVGEVVFFCGDKRLGILPAKLKEAGIKVKELEVYRTVETPNSVAGAYDGVLFFSPSAVSSFFSVNGVAEQTVLFAIGNTTAEAIKEKTSNKVIVCETQSKEDVLRQAIRYFQKQAERVTGA
jgi:uroporphyrinogen-III synthase